MIDLANEMSVADGKGTVTVADVKNWRKDAQDLYSFYDRDYTLLTLDEEAC